MNRIPLVFVAFVACKEPVEHSGPTPYQVVERARLNAMLRIRVAADRVSHAHAQLDELERRDRLVKSRRDEAVAAAATTLRERPATTSVARVTHDLEVARSNDRLQQLDRDDNALAPEVDRARKDLELARSCLERDGSGC